MTLRVLRPWPRLVSMSRSGRYVAIRAPGGLELVDALGTAPRQSVAAPDLVDFTCVGAHLWLLEGAQIRRLTLDGARPVEPAIALPGPGAGLEPTVGDSAQTALVLGEEPVLAHAIYDRVSADPIDPGDDALFALIGKRVLAAGGDGVRFLEVGRGEVGRATLGDVGPVLSASALFSGRAVAVLCRGENQDVFVVLKPNGALIHKISLPRTRRWAVADNRGVAIVAADEVGVIVVDLRYGRVQSESAAPWPVHDLDVDADGQYVVLAGAPEAGGLPAVLHTPATDLFSVAAVARRATMTAVARGDDAEVRPERGPSVPRLQLSLRDDGGPTPPAASTVGHLLATSAAPVPVDAADSEAPVLDGVHEAPPPPVVVPDAPPLAFGVALPPITIEASGDWPPYTSAREHLDEMLDLVAARAARAIAEAWNSGRLSVPSEDARPFEREVRALLGHVGGYAPELMAESDERLARMTARSGGRTRATLARGIRLPFVELSREFGLSSVAAHVLMVAMAPSARGEIARLFGILGNDENRPIVDRFLIETVIGGGDKTARFEVARELAEDAPLLRYGLLRITANDRAQLFGAITVDPVLIERVRGRPTHGGHGDVTVMRKADRTLEQLHMAPEVKRDLVLALANRRSDDDPVRVVVRGRRGAGRHSLIAALAARVERSIACIDCFRLPRAGKLMATALRQELFRAVLRGAVPVVSGLEAADPGDAEGQDLIKQTLRAHPGPVVIRAAPEASLPLDPGFVTATIPSMLEGERGVFWHEALTRAGLHCGDVDAMAARYRVGPGVIEHVIAQVLARRAHEAPAAGARPPDDDSDDDVAPLLEEVARQHIASRLTHIATHVKRLAKWEQVSLPDDAVDSVREFIARIRHRKTVYEKWGFDSKMSTARGLTALFYGPPGTGKSMVAGLIARELGLDLYRIDLARIVSKWIGETEKNLAEVFDAAEDGQVVVLFDEADSLFAKRTEVKSSVDRYANLEVNYLLQRLDSFEGVAILTTNLEGSIDLAFKRRMSLRLHFPFPDEEMRVRLWAAHIPVETPVSGDFDFVELARRFPLSGGYIRNSTLRAAFLAAQENRPLSHEHMVRAIALEYRELGKLSSGGRME